MSKDGKKEMRGGIYKENEGEMKQIVKQTTGREELDKLDKYRLLLWSVGVHKQVNSGGTTGVKAVISPLEGNNRAGAHVHMILGLKYDAREGLLKCVSLGGNG